MWATEGEKHLTPDLSALVQEVIDRPGWSSGHNMAFVISGSGERAAKSHDADAAGAPLLTVTFAFPPDTE